jgi:hypothetical protein
MRLLPSGSSPRLSRAKPACAGYTGVIVQRPSHFSLERGHLALGDTTRAGRPRSQDVTPGVNRYSGSTSAGATTTGRVHISPGSEGNLPSETRRGRDARAPRVSPAIDALINTAAMGRSRSHGTLALSEGNLPSETRRGRDARAPRVSPAIDALINTAAMGRPRSHRTPALPRDARAQRRHLALGDVTQAGRPRSQGVTCD